MANPKRWPIGLQSSVKGNPQGIGEVIRELTANNIALFSASTDSTSILTDLENARRDNPHVHHTGNFCLTGYWPKEETGGQRYHLNVPEYGVPASEEMAKRHWDMVEMREPINDPKRSPIKWDVPCLWLSTWNEISDYVGWFKQEDKKKVPTQVVEGYEGNADLIGWQAVEIGKEALKRGYRWAAFGFAGGNPEVGFWEAPGVLAYLRLCEERPDSLGVALHEYALADTILNKPDNIGRFKLLHETCDKHGIRRPVIQIKEFGWRDVKIPDDKNVAMAELIEVARMYMEHPNIHGAAIWTVQPWQNSGIDNKVRDLIPLIRDAALAHAQEIPPLKAAPKPTVAHPPKPVVTSPTDATVGIVNAIAGLRLRSEPDIAGGDSTTIDKLPFGTRVTILGFDKGWYHVQADDKTGFVSAAHITLVPSGQDGAKGMDDLLEATDTLTAISPSKTGTITAEAGLRLRTEPTIAGGDATIIRELEFGSTVEIIGQVRDWYQVKAGNDTGYAFQPWVTLTEPGAVGGKKGPATGGFQPGMNINTGVHPLDIDRLRGLSWVRFVLIAEDAGRSIDEAFRDTYEPMIREYAKAGIRSLIILNHQTVHGNRPWATPEGATRDWAAYAEPYGQAARRVAQLVAPFGNMVAFQIGNEQDSGWRSDANNKNPSAHGIPPEDYALILKAAADSIRAAAPQATIVTGGVKTGKDNGSDYLLSAQKRLGGRLPVDAIAIHPYGSFVLTDPYYGEKHGKLPDALAVYRRKLPRYPVWITEMGIPGHDHPLGPEHYQRIGTYMNEIVTEVATRHSDHAPVLIWFAWTDGMENAGMLTADGQEKEFIYPAFLSMKARGVAAGQSKALEDMAKSLVGQKGFVSASTVAGLNLRSEPSTAQGSASIMTTLATGTEVEILGDDVSGWYRVRANGQEGFVSAEFITFVAPSGQKAGATSTAGGAKNRTGSVIGIHGAPGAAAPPMHTWDMWIDRLNQMGVKWYKQCETSDGTGDGSIFQWVLKLKENGIEPIIRYLQSSQFPNNLEEKHFRQMRRYAEHGIRYAEIGNEPNLEYEWVSEWRGKYEGEEDNRRMVEVPRMRKDNPEAVEALARVWIQDATRAAEMGASPAFYAFGPTDLGEKRPNGLYSSVLFTDKVVARLASHHRAETVRLFNERNAWIAVHVAAYEKALDYSPYSEDPNRPWDMCLRGYEVVLNAFRRNFGNDLNMGTIKVISTEGGVFVPEHRNKTDDRGPSNDEDHAKQTLAMYRYVRDHTPLTAMCPWCISEGGLIGHGDKEFHNHGWFKDDNGQLVERPVYRMMREWQQAGGKGLSFDELLEAVPSGGLEQAAPQPAAETTVTITITIQIKVQGGVDAKDIVVNVSPQVE